MVKKAQKADPVIDPKAEAARVERREKQLGADR